MHPSTNFVRSLGERACLVAWMILMMANTILVGLTVELLVFGFILSVYHINLIDSGTLPFLTMGFIAALNFPLVIKLHRLGVTHLNFEIHENIMSSAPESWQNLILSLLDESSTRSHHLEKLVRAIEEAPTAADRQERRTEAKSWLIENNSNLTEEDQEMVLEHLSYLKLP